MEFTKARVLVVGGGIVGASIAWRLAQRGYAVSILEKRTLGAEASGASAGMLAPGGEVDQDTQLATLAVESRRLWPQFVRELSEVSGLTIAFIREPKEPTAPSTCRSASSLSTRSKTLQNFWRFLKDCSPMA